MLDSTPRIQNDISSLDSLEKYPHGVWRDSGLVVVRWEGATFPSPCPKTNQPSEGEQGVEQQASLRWIPPQHAAQVLGAFILSAVTGLGLIFALIYVFAVVEKTSVTANFSRAYLARRTWASRVGWLALISGLAGVGVSTYLFFAYPTNDATYSQYFAYAPFVGTAVAFAGALVLAIWCRPHFQVEHFERGYLWLKGVHPDYLVALPEWPG